MSETERKYLVKKLEKAISEASRQIDAMDLIIKLGSSVKNYKDEKRAYQEVKEQFTDNLKDSRSKLVATYEEFLNLLNEYIND